MTFKIRKDMERLENTLTIDEFLEMQEGNLKSIINVMSKFVLDDNSEYKTPEEGRKVIGSLTLAELKNASEDFNKKITDAAVPPENASGS